MFAAATTIAAQAAGTVAVDDLWLNFMIGAVIPLLVGLLTKLNASAGLKAVINLLLAAVLSGAQQLMQGDSLTSKELFIKVMTTWMMSIVSYYGLHKPTGSSDKVSVKTRKFGLGTPPAPEMETQEQGVEEIAQADVDTLDHDELYKLAQAQNVKGRTKMSDDELRAAVRSAE